MGTAAVELGWSERELFGLVANAPALKNDRLDAEGLAVGVSLSRFALTIESMNGDEAVLVSKDGASLRHSRQRTNFSAIPLWECTEV